MVSSPRDTAERLSQELRRGAIVLAILSRLQAEHYGYSLREELAGEGLEIHEGTLYPLLRRLEAQGLLESRWRMEEARPRRYYRISSQGRETLTRLEGEWQSLNESLDRLMNGKGC